MGEITPETMQKLTQPYVGSTILAAQAQTNYGPIQEHLRSHLKTVIAHTDGFLARVESKEHEIALAKVQFNEVSKFGDFGPNGNSAASACLHRIAKLEEELEEIKAPIALPDVKLQETIMRYAYAEDSALRNMQVQLMNLKNFDNLPEDMQKAYYEILMEGHAQEYESQKIAAEELSKKKSSGSTISGKVNENNSLSLASLLPQNQYFQQTLTISDDGKVSFRYAKPAIDSPEFSKYLRHTVETLQEDIFAGQKAAKQNVELMCGMVPNGTMTNQEIAGVLRDANFGLSKRLGIFAAGTVVGSGAGYMASRALAAKLGEAATTSFLPKAGLVLGTIAADAGADMTLDLTFSSLLSRAQQAHLQANGISEIPMPKPGELAEMNKKAVYEGMWYEDTIFEKLDYLLGFGDEITDVSKTMLIEGRVVPSLGYPGDGLYKEMIDQIPSGELIEGQHRNFELKQPGRLETAKLIKNYLDETAAKHDVIVANGGKIPQAEQQIVAATELAANNSNERGL